MDIPPDRPHRKASRPSISGDYKGGHGRPSKETQIKRGEIRSPWGRGGRPDRRKAKMAPEVDDLGDDTFAQEVARLIDVTENGKTKKQWAGRVGYKMRSGHSEPFYEKLALQVLGIDKLKAVKQDA